jgi:tRNA(fMet)-specific endonuclease VapC
MSSLGAPESLPGVLFDTSVLINLLRKSQKHIDLLRGLLQRNFVLAVSSINIAELYAGMRHGEEQITAQLLAGFIQFPLSPSIAQSAGEIVAAQRRAGQTNTLDDMLIAATAIEHGYALATDNGRDFLIPRLTLFPIA